MNFTQTWAPTTATPTRRMPGPTAIDGVAEAVEGAWHEIDTVLTPVIGRGGVASLFRRSLEQVCAHHAWLSAAAGHAASLVEHVGRLTLALLRQSPREAAAASGRHLVAFYHLLGGLLGPQLAHQLQVAVRLRSASDPSDWHGDTPAPLSPRGDPSSSHGAGDRKSPPAAHAALDLVQVINEVVATYRLVLADRDQQFVVTLPPAPVMLSGDAVRVGLVLAHLFDNATKYTPEGGEIGVSLQVEARHVSVAVWDSGIGIEADALHRIFHPYVREPRAARFADHGLGLGLTRALELAQSQGGNLNAHSAGPGLGSCFVFTLPRAVHTPTPPTSAVG